MSTFPRRLGGSRLGAAAAAAALAAIWVLMAAGPVAAIETQRFGIEPYPLFEGNEVRRSFDVALAPGGSVTEAVRVWNKTKQPVEVRLYGAAVDVADGAYEVAPYEARGQGAGAWVVPDRSLVRLDPGQDEVVEFTVHVPPVLGEGRPATALVAESDTGLSSAGVDVVARLAMLVRVGPADSLFGSFSWWIILAALLALAAAVAGLTLRRRARRASS
ncbi:MAG: hypothetical protein ACRDI0_12890 [Actinomycetota bacterium]